MTNVDEAPGFGADSYAFSMAEKAAIGTESVTDQEGVTVVYDITAGTEASHRAFDTLAGDVVVAAQLNRATTPSYSLTIKASTGRDSPSATITVTQAG